MSEKPLVGEILPALIEGPKRRFEFKPRKGKLLEMNELTLLKIKNLAELMSAGNVSLEDRAQVLERGRSVARVSIIDSEEEYKRETTTVTGLPELLDRACNRLAGAMDIPVSRLLGEAPAGLNATGDSDIRWWYGTVDSERKSKAKPPLERIVRLRFLAQNGPTHGKVPERSGIYFPSLWRPSEKEAAEIRFQQAQTDQIYINTGVLMVSEVAKSRFGGEEYSVDTQLDADARGSMNEIQDVPEKEPLVELPNGTKQTTDVPVVKGENLGFGDAIHDQPRAIDGRVREGTAGPTKFAGHSAKQLHEKLKEIGGDKDHPDASEFAVEMRRRGLDADSLAKAAKQARPRDANRTR